MDSDQNRYRGDVPFKAAGVGHSPCWLCMGCHTPRDQAGAQGKGVFKRCAHCLAAKALRKQTEGAT